MHKLFKHVFNAVYVAMFFYFTRRTFGKIVETFDDVIPMVSQDTEGWYAIRLYHKYFIYSDLHRGQARNIAKGIYDEIPELRGYIDIVQIYEADITMLEDIVTLSDGNRAKIIDVYDRLIDD